MSRRWTCPRTTPSSSTRRAGAAGGRIFDPEAYSPPLSWAVGTASKAPLAALKIAPGIPHEAIPAEAEAEWISDGGDVKEAVLWFGTEPGRVRATLLPGPRALRGRGLPDPAVRSVGRYLYEPDGAVIRAHLVAEVAEELDGGLIDETIAYITADELRATPYATAYEITDQLPFSVKKLKALLRERGGRHPDGEEAGVGGRAGGAAPEGAAEAAGSELGDGVPDPGRGGADDAGGASAGGLTAAKVVQLTRTRARSSSRSRSLRVSAIARSNSARASAVRPSRASRSPRTLGSKW